jgi:uncharacterized protein
MRLRLQAVIFAGVVSLPVARADLALVCDSPGGPVKIERVGADHLIGTNGRELVRLPLDGRFRVEGDLRAGTRFLFWPPYFFIHHPPTRDRVPPDQRPWFGYTRLVNGRGWAGPKAEEIWIEKLPEAAVVVLGWMVRGAIVRTRLAWLPAKPHRERFRLDLAFHLTPAEAEGQPVILLWANGTFVPVRPSFRDAAAQQAMEAMLLFEHAAFRRALTPAILRSTSRHGYKLLQLAAVAGNLDAIDAILERGAKADTILNPAPLAAAAARGRVQVVERLLAANANPNRSDRFHSPLQLALRGGHDAVAERLVDAGAKPIGGSAEAQPLTQAIAGGHAGLARKLLERLAPRAFAPSARELMEQVALGHTALVALLLEYKADANVTVNGTTPLLMAARARDPDMVKTLLAAGARTELADASGWTPLMLTALTGDVQSAQHLLAAGASVAVRRADGNTSLHLAALQQSPDLAAALMDHGADPNAGNAAKMRPLEVALLAGRESTARLLLQHGASPNLRAAYAPRLIEAAVMLDLPEIVERAFDEEWAAEAVLPGGASVVRLARLAGATEVQKLLARAAPGSDATTTAVVLPGELDRMPELMREAQPPDPTDYSEGAGEQRVDIELVIDEAGRVVGSKLQQCPGGHLAVACIETVRTWQFEPPRRAGVPVATRVTRSITFPVPQNVVIDRTFLDAPPISITRWIPYAGPYESAGDVRLQCVIDREGHAGDFRVLEAKDMGHARNAINAAPDWAFTPGMMKGAPVNTRIEIVVPVNF